MFFNKKCTPSIGDYLCLTKYKDVNCEIPCKVIDVKKDKIALQVCNIIDKDGRVIQDNEQGMIILLTWCNKFGWCWRINYFDKNPYIISRNNNELFIKEID